MDHHFRPFRAKQIVAGAIAVKPVVSKNFHTSMAVRTTSLLRSSWKNTWC